MSSTESGCSSSALCLSTLFSQPIYIYLSEEYLQRLFFTWTIPIFGDKRQLPEQPRNLLFLRCFCSDCNLVSICHTDNNPWGSKFSGSYSRHWSCLSGGCLSHPITLLASFLFQWDGFSKSHTEFYLSEPMICAWSINHVFSLFCCPLWTSHTFLHQYSSHMN